INLNVFVAGEGGPAGVTLGEDGPTLAPSVLRDALCALRTDHRVRRVLVEVASGYAGVYGAAASGGVESGCGGETQGGEPQGSEPQGSEPLGGVLVMTAGTAHEGGLARVYDPTAGLWVGTDYSRALLERFEQDERASILDVYRAIYTRVAGSHVQLYNAAQFGALDALEMLDELYGRRE
ncbi:MAG: hypothetical protein KC583_21950, partial [Myxococcales bacterium]|nr:hypothetical protein [Myxococcales bacterium]